MRYKTVVFVLSFVAMAAGADSDTTVAEKAADAASNARGWRSIAVFGAVGDGETVNTEAIQKAIDRTHAAGGGTVFFPAGKWVSGTLILKNNVTLHLDSGAVLLGSTNLDDYPRHKPAYRSYTDEYVEQALLYAENARDIAVVGRGTIDGRGGDPAFAPTDKKDIAYLRRPYLIRFVSCRGVHVEGVTLRDSPMWTQHYLDCQDVTITRINVFGHVNLNNDMLDIDGCRNVRVTGCTGDCEDDAITLKSSGPALCENVTISDCVVSSHCNGFKMGTETTGGFRNITVTNLVVRPSAYPVKNYGRDRGSGGVVLLMVDGGVLENVTITNVVIEGTEAPIFLRLGNRARKHTPAAPAPGMGRMRNVIIGNLIATGASKQGSTITGLPGHAIENLTLRDIHISTLGGGTAEDAGRTIEEKPAGYPDSLMFGTVPAYGLFIRHVRGLTMDNVRLTHDAADARPAIVFDDVRDVLVRNLSADAEPGCDAMVLRDVRGALVTGCAALSTGGAFLRLLDGTERISIIGNDLSRAGKPWVGEHLDEAFFESANRLPSSER